jgi:hypothetical protein
MNDNATRNRRMFTRVDGFGESHVNDFGANSIARGLFLELKSPILSEINRLASLEASGHGTARQGTDVRAACREVLREDLRAIRRTARALVDEVPGFGEKFNIPAEDNDELLLNAARAFGSDAEAESAKFAAHEMPTDFLETLQAHTTDLEESIRDQQDGTGEHVAASVGIGEVIRRGNVVVRKLDAIIRNKYANNPAVLAEWTAASHMERAPHRKAPDTPPAA